MRTWESSERTTRPKNSDIDGVGIVAILEKESGETVLSFLFFCHFFHSLFSTEYPGIQLSEFNANTRPGPEIMLQKQFRPPVHAVTIEVPAGLVDEGETAEQAAVRELREETGYVGVASGASPVMFNGLFPHPSLSLKRIGGGISYTRSLN